MSRLSEDQLNFFHTEGYLVAREIIPESYLLNLQDEIAGVIDDTANELQREGKITELREDLDFLHRTTALYDQSTEIIRNINSGSHAGKAIFELIACPDLLDVVEQLLGQEIIASSVYRIRPKLPFRAEGVVPWHQDSGYFDPVGDDDLILTVWIPLMNATVEAGCMEVIPRSHTCGVVRHYWASTPAPPLTVHPDHLPDTQPVPVPANIGDAVLLTNLTMHQSTENNSGLIRWATDLRYNAPEAGNYYPFEAEFLARSQKSPEKVITDWREFYRLRNEHVLGGSIDRGWLKEEQ